MKKIKTDIHLPETELRKLIGAGQALKGIVSREPSGKYVVNVETDSLRVFLCSERGRKVRCWIDLDRAIEAARSLGLPAAEVSLDLATNI